MTQPTVSKHWRKQ